MQLKGPVMTSSRLPLGHVSTHIEVPGMMMQCLAIDLGGILEAHPLAMPK